MVSALLTTWTHTGFIAHTRTVAEFYRHKRDVFARAMETELTGFAEWTVPEAGMFFWFKLLIGGEEDSEQVIKTRAFEAGVLALPGVVFMPGGEKTGYVRASFSLLDEADVREALRRLRGVVEEERRIRGLA
jgi:tryptophan aminotransferase